MFELDPSYSKCYVAKTVRCSWRGIWIQIVQLPYWKWVVLHDVGKDNSLHFFLDKTICFSLQSSKMCNKKLEISIWSQILQNKAEGSVQALLTLDVKCKLRLLAKTSLLKISEEICMHIWFKNTFKSMSYRRLMMDIMIINTSLARNLMHQLSQNKCLLHDFKQRPFDSNKVLQI